MKYEGNTEGNGHRPRSFWTNGSISDWIGSDDLGRDCMARHPDSLGEKCAYGNPRDKPAAKRLGCCPFSLDKEIGQVF